jgi:hypothetical protein
MIMIALAATDRLPAPPLAGTACIDEKLAFARSAQLRTATLIAIGSSATWRNLDMGRLENALPGTRAINAAACYLHIDQTAFLATHLLARAPQVKRVLTVVAPRDFENCNPQDTEIADPTLLRGYLAGTVPGWFVHLVNLRLPYIIGQAFSIKAERQGGLGSDAHGSSPLHRPVKWNPAPVLDRRCFDALATLQAAVAAQGARLIVATVPVMPGWRARFDPDGRIVDQWIEDIRARLGVGSLLIDGRALSWPDERFADPVHLLWPEGAAYSDFIAAAMKEAGS